MYKDKGKQREAAKERQRRYRDKQKGVTRVGVTCGALLLAEPQGMTFTDLPADVQADIEMMAKSHDAAGINTYEAERQARTVRAIHYQQHIRAG